MVLSEKNKGHWSYHGHWYVLPVFCEVWIAHLHLFFVFFYLIICFVVRLNFSWLVAIRGWHYHLKRGSFVSLPRSYTLNDGFFHNLRNTLFILFRDLFGNLCICSCVCVRRSIHTYIRYLIKTSCKIIEIECLHTKPAIVPAYHLEKICIKYRTHTFFLLYFAKLTLWMMNLYSYVTWHQTV